MKNKAMESRLSDEVMAFINSRRSLQLASIDPEGVPFASYAPFAIGDECLYVLLSEIALHAINLQSNPTASVLIIEDEDSAGELFARVRVNYTVRAERIEYDSQDWHTAMQALTERHGERPRNLGEHTDFKMFRLVPERGRYVKGFGKAYTLAGESLAGEAVDHLRDGHKRRSAA
ncbi:MAG: pyridoxamine 5'-phosphate oxidase family protein [Halieaceae bacterium]|jgi:putative heme iron utilization protein|nr:pyridoxamine 5'-phosphate oxidase family protein [Halieaceae bacterium]